MQANLKSKIDALIRRAKSFFNICWGDELFHLLAPRLHHARSRKESGIPDSISPSSIDVPPHFGTWQKYISLPLYLKNGTELFLNSSVLRPWSQYGGLPKELRLYPISFRIPNLRDSIFSRLSPTNPVILIRASCINYRFCAMHELNPERMPKKMTLISTHYSSTSEQQRAQLLARSEQRNQPSSSHQSRPKSC